MKVVELDELCIFCNVIELKKKDEPFLAKSVRYNLGFTEVTIFGGKTSFQTG
jgi:hypothetical protein